MMINPTICSNSKMICRTLSLIANSTWLSDASAAVLTADTCEFCLGRHPFLRKIITNGERFSLIARTHVSSQSAVVTTTTKEGKEYIMIVRLLTMSTID